MLRKDSSRQETLSHSTWNLTLMNGAPMTVLESDSVIILSVWLSFTSLAAVAGNALEMWLFYKHESLRTTSNRFIISLATADFLVGLVIAPVWIAERYVIQPPYTSAWTKNFEHVMGMHDCSYNFQLVLCFCGTALIAICFPLRYTFIITKRTCHSSIILAWVASMLLPLSLIFVREEKMGMMLSVATFLTAHHYRCLLLCMDF